MYSNTIILKTKHHIKKRDVVLSIHIFTSYHFLVSNKLQHHSADTVVQYVNKDLLSFEIDSLVTKKKTKNEPDTEK